MKGQIWLTDVKHLKLSNGCFMLITFFVCMHMCVQFQCEMLMIAAKTQWLLQSSYKTSKHGILKDDRYEGINMAYKCKVFKAVNLTFQGHYYVVYMHMYGQFQRYWHKYRERNMSAKQGTCSE